MSSSTSRRSAIAFGIASKKVGGGFSITASTSWGPRSVRVEGQLAEFTGAAEVVSCSNGTDALWVPLLALGIGPGDAVFLPSWTFTATAEVVCLVGATPVFVDVDLDTMNLSPASLAAAVKAIRQEGRLTPRLIIPVDLFGLPADYAAINAIAREEGLKVLADAAQSFGATQGNRRVGALADVTSTSFFPAKPLGCWGDGGAMFTDDPERPRRCVRSGSTGAAATANTTMSASAPTRGSTRFRPSC